MAPKPLKNTTICVILPNSDLNWDKTQLKTYIGNLGGRFETSLSKSTTHVVANEEAWNSRVKTVAAALSKNLRGESSIKMMKSNWLIEACFDSCKPKEGGPYVWTDIKSMRKKTKTADGEEVQGMAAPKSAVGLTKQALLDSTGDFLTEKDEKEIEKHKETLREQQQEKELREQQEKAQQKEDLREKKEHEKKLAKALIFDEDNHIYEDNTGFPYDVLLIKADSRQNTNERWNLKLQIWESNGMPHTYSMNMSFSETKTRDAKNTLVIKQTTYSTVFHKFKTAFKEKTGLEWDDRIDGYERLRGAAKQSPETMKNKSFTYHPPTSGPRGRLPDKMNPVAAFDFGASILGKRKHERKHAIAMEQPIMRSCK